MKITTKIRNYNQTIDCKKQSHKNFVIDSLNCNTAQFLKSENQINFGSLNSFTEKVVSKSKDIVYKAENLLDKMAESKPVKVECPELFKFLNLKSDEGVSMILDSGEVSVNTRNERGETLLHIASRREDLPLMDKLSAYPDLDVMAIDGDGNSSGIVAANFSQNESLKKIREMNHPDFNPNYVNRKFSYHKSMLHSVTSPSTLDEVAQFPGIDLNLSTRKLKPFAFQLVDRGAHELFGKFINLEGVNTNIKYQRQDLVTYIKRKITKVINNKKVIDYGSDYNSRACLNHLQDKADKEFCAKFSSALKKKGVVDLNDINYYIDYPNFKTSFVQNQLFPPNNEPIWNYLAYIKVDNTNRSTFLKTFNKLIAIYKNPMSLMEKSIELKNELLIDLMYDDSYASRLKEKSITGKEIFAPRLGRIKKTIEENGTLSLKQIDEYINFKYFKTIANEPLNLAGECIGHLLADVRVTTENMKDVLRIIDRLLDVRYDFKVVDKYGRTPLEKSKVAQNSLMAELIEKNTR